MRSVAVIAVTLALVGAPHHGHPHHHPAPASHVTHHAPKPLVHPATMRAWLRVYVCETHNWAQRGHYAGGLGITQWNWEHNGGLRFARAPYLATPEQQVYVATVIQHGLPVPDQTSTCKDW